MAPQQNSATKRKRPSEISASSKKDSSRNAAESISKRVKASDSKAAAEKKGPSKALPVAPLAVSSLKCSVKEEASFPRGGGSLLTPLEYKEVANQAIKDVLFEAGGGRVSKTHERDLEGDVDMVLEGEKKVKQKKRKFESGKKKKSVRNPKEDEGPKVEGFSFKRIVPGTIVLGCVSQINSTDVAISLPNNITGYVPITSISEQLTKKIEALLEEDGSESEEEKEEQGDPKVSKGRKKANEDVTDLNRYFRVGQYVRACIMSTADDTLKNAEHSRYKKHIELSLQPSMANAGVTVKELVTGCAIQASVTSVEDHGLIMSLGLEDKSITGFISSNELGDHFTLATVQEGQVLLCTITGMASNGKIVKLSADIGKPIGAKKGKGAIWKGGLWLNEAPTIDAFTPGTGVELLVTDVGKNGGIRGKIMGMLDCAVDYFHAQGWAEKELEDRVKVGNKINARVLFTNPNSDPKKLNLSVLPHILTLGSPSEAVQQYPTKALPISTIVDETKITKVDPKRALFIDVGISGIPGFVHISRISDKKIEDLSGSTGNYKVGSVHRARVVGYNPIDGLFICSMEQKILDQNFLRVEDVKVGEVVKGVIKKLLPSGSLIVQLSEGITAIVDGTHLSDIKLKNPERKFREGMSVTCRVLRNDPEKKQLRVTLKKALVNSDAPIITSYEDATPGIQTPGTLVAILPHRAIVKFYSDVTAFLPVSEMSEAYIKDPREHFHIGQSVNVHVVNVDVENERMWVSCRDPNAFGEAQQKALQNLQLGQIVSGTVVEKSDDDLVLELQDVGADGLKGILLTSHLVDGSKQKAAQAFRNMRAGQTLKDLVVIGKKEAKRLITLSLKPSLVSTVKEGKLIRGVDDVREGDVCKGFISNITFHNLLVTFPGGGYGAISKLDIPREKVSLPDFGMERNQSITATVCKVDHEKCRFNLTLNPYEPRNELPERPKKPKKCKLTENKGESAALINPVDESLKTIDDIVLGRITKAKIVSVKETQINVQLSDDVQGRIDVAQVYDTWSDIKNKKHPLEHFKRDQILDVKIIGIHDARNHRFLAITHKVSNTRTVFELSAKPSDLKLENESALTLNKIKEGSSWVAFVNNHGEDCVWVNLSPSVRGRIKILDLSEDAGLLKSLSKHFPIGSALKCTVIHVDESKNQLDLSARSNPGIAITYDTIQKGMVLPARVTKIAERQIIVQLSEHVSGPVNMTDMADDYTIASPSNFTKNEIIRVCVLDVDNNSNRVALSTRPSRVLSSSSAVKDPEILTLANVSLGNVLRGFVKHVSDKGIFVTLGGSVTAFVRVSEISDMFIKDWKSAIKVSQLVKGKVIAIEQAVGQVQMSLKPSVVEGRANPQIHLNELQVGQIVRGTVRSVADYGVFIVVDGSANVSGLCHKSEISDKKVEDVKKLYSPGDSVKAKVLSIDLEKRKISFGLKASYFEHADEDEDENMEDSEDDSEGGVNLATAVDYESDKEGEEGSDKDAEVSDEEMEDAPSLRIFGTGLNTNGFDWTGSILDALRSDTQPDSDASDSDSKPTERKRKKKSLASKIKQDLTGDLQTRAPESVSDFERLLMGNPQSGELWVRYMAFQLQLLEVDKAREIAERALKTITSVTQEGLKEKEVIWAAMLNMELEYGTEETLEEVFKRACVYNDSLDMHEKMCNIYIQAGKYEKADSLYKTALKKHGNQSSTLWTTYAAFLFSPPLSSPDRARALLPRALQILPAQPESTHRTLISKFAQLEFTRGDPERGRTIFENLTSTYPGKSDLLMVWVDMEMKLAKESGEKDEVRSLLNRKLGRGGKLKPKVAKVLFKKWLEWEEKGGDKKGAAHVQRLAKEYAERATKEKMDKERLALMEKGMKEEEEEDTE
ncbi:hypothetical protein BDZ91DRAFT_774053 [Kalaharituber pfeilii]|nr:hypothetical protein BDZ91DRAFT_774053 [Kalaharituber pfeilii]